ncbi:MAG TPA: hypothetical protein VKX17_05585 [Planctomycetota bacterium]|nr:hypothetical protein [Planctomycetota bacterium]
MRLHWFREHKMIVYWILLPGVGIGLLFYGVFGRTGSFFTETGPSIQYTVGNRSVELSPTEVLSRRSILNALFPYDPNSRNDENPTSANIGKIAAEDDTARNLGFEIGDKELDELVRNAAIQKWRELDRIQETNLKLTPEVYDKLLSQMNLSNGQFRTVVHDLMLREKFRRNVESAIVEPDSALFVKYCEKKENARFRFKTLKSTDFLAKTAEPKEDEIKKFYDDKANKSIYTEIFKTEPTLSVEGFFYKEDEQKFKDADRPSEQQLKDTFEKYKVDKWKDKTLESVKADVEKQWKEDQIKNYYDIRKMVYWEDPAKKGTYKPFDSVKDDVEKQWHIQNLEGVKSKVQFYMSQTERDLAKDIETFNNSKYPRVEFHWFSARYIPGNMGKEFDMAAWAKAHHMEYWVTGAHTQDEFKKGKNELKSETPEAAERLFDYASPPPNFPPSMIESYKKHMDDFTSLNWTNPEKPELGGIMVRKKVYNEAREKTLDEAKPKIVEHLKTLESVNLAEEAAKKLRDDWTKEPPKLDDLDEVTSEKKPSHPIVAKFKEDPKAVGELLDVASGRPEQDDKKPVEMDKSDIDRKWFYVGCAVERKLPTEMGFKRATDTDFNKDQERGMMRYYDMQSAMFALIDPIQVHRIGENSTDPDIRTVLRDSHE